MDTDGFARSDGAPVALKALAVLLRRLGARVHIDADEMAGLGRFDEVSIDRAPDGSVVLDYRRRVELEGEAEEVPHGS